MNLTTSRERVTIPYSTALLELDDVMGRFTAHQLRGDSWQLRHLAALHRPSPVNFGHETGELGIVLILAGLAELVALHAPHGTDTYVTPALAEIIEQTRTLLSTNIGNRLDPGTLDADLVALAEAIGLDVDTGELAAG